MKNAEHIYAIRTTRKPEDWVNIKQLAQEIINKDISDFMPIFLTVKDFDIAHDPTFKPWDMISSWWQYKKIPVLILSDLNEFNNMNDMSRIILESASIMIH
jgi:hypothetical protein